MRMSVDIDIDNVLNYLPDVLAKLSPEEWSKIATQVVLQVYSDPAKWESVVDLEMQREYTTQPQAPWVTEARRLYSSYHRPEDSATWRNERNRRIQLNPAAQVISETKKQIGSLLETKIREVIGQDDQLKEIVLEAVKGVNLQYLIDQGIRNAFRGEIARIVADTRQ